jgi:hypothetical protein
MSRPEPQSLQVDIHFDREDGDTKDSDGTPTMGPGDKKKVAERWDISVHDFIPRYTAHLLDERYSDVDGQSWKYVFNKEDSEVENINEIAITDSFAPSGTFVMDKWAPMKVEIRVLSFWEIDPLSVDHWDTLFRVKNEQEQQEQEQPEQLAEQVPVFVNFICGASTVINLQKVTDAGMILFEDNAKAEFSEDLQYLQTIERFEYEDLQVPMPTAIMGRVSPSRAHLVIPS